VEPKVSRRLQLNIQLWFNIN